MSLNQAGADKARIVRVASGFGKQVTVLRTQYRSQRFARHSHDDYTLGFVLSGAGTFWCRGTERVAKKGDLVVIPPGEIHTGSVGPGVKSLSYLAVYLPVDVAVSHAAAAGIGGGKPPDFRMVVLRDAIVGRAYQTLDKLVPLAGKMDLDEGAAEEAVCTAVTALMHRHAHRDKGHDIPRFVRESRSEPRLVGIVRAALQDSYADAEATSLSALATQAGVTPFQVIRSFRRATGLPPHQFLIQVRVERARQLLADGTIPSLVALRTGFTDQSHLTLHFKKHFGITPGSYQRCVLGSGFRRPSIFSKNT